ncbi:hypothetical protein FA15DRAFT_364720 [Coprinopsis marcescibilis]|uniref:Uncharacterized protein n=1 Tax=Coprinopsis marcescibilis TaxID=230819 RepID=A0A5C3KYE4_COPMA|nr:hypothetical protein FA15DRAFT_364720 [Coprinopsis marcescibilis]
MPARSHRRRTGTSIFAPTVALSKLGRSFEQYRGGELRRRLKDMFRSSRRILCLPLESMMNCGVVCYRARGPIWTPSLLVFVAMRIYRTGSESPNTPAVASACLQCVWSQAPPRGLNLIIQILGAFCMKCGVVNYLMNDFI